MSPVRYLIVLCLCLSMFWLRCICTVSVAARTASMVCCVAVWCQSICLLAPRECSCSIAVSAMASAHVRVLNAVSGAVLLPRTLVPCARLVSNVLGLLGSRPSRPVKLLLDGWMVDGVVDYPFGYDGAYLDFTATIGDALTVEDCEKFVDRLSHACDARGWCCHVFMTFSAAARDDRRVVLVAVALDPDCLQDASEALRNDREIVLLAVRHRTGDRSAVLKWASSSLRNDREVVLAALANDGACNTCLEYVSQELRMDKELVLVAMRQGGRLEFVPSFQNDKEVVLESVRRCGVSLQFASEACQNDKEIVLAAMQQNGYGLQFASEALRDDEEIVSAALRHYGDYDSHVLCFASLRLQCR